MSLRSVFRLRQHELGCDNGTGVEDNLIVLRLRNPIRGKVFLREVGSDVLTLREVIKEQVYAGVLTHVKECNTVIDLGANVGLASLYFAALFPNCRLLAVEPNPSSYRILTLNLKDLIQVGRCRALRAAVWSSETNLVTQFDEPNHYSTVVTREATAGEGGNKAGALGLPIADIIAASGFEMVDLLKIDVEGAEVELFKGDNGFLRRVNAIAIEFHGNSREVSGFDRIMRQYQFRVEDSGAHTVLALRENREPSQGTSI